MAKINELSAVDTVVAGDLIPVFDTNNGDARKASMTVIQTFMQANLDFDATAVFTTVRVTADVTFGYSVGASVITANNTWIILIAVGTHPTITITLPGSSSSSPVPAADKQEVLVYSSEIITTVTVTTFSPTVLAGAPTTLAADGFFKMRYDLITDTWYIIG